MFPGRKYRVLLCRKVRSPAKNLISRIIVTVTFWSHSFLIVLSPFINHRSQPLCDFLLFPSPTTYTTNMSTQSLQAYLEQLQVTVTLDP